jgi:arginase
MERAIKLIKNRSDIGAGTRGSDLGIDARNCSNQKKK